MADGVAGGEVEPVGCRGINRVIGRCHIIQQKRIAYCHERISQRHIAQGDIAGVGDIECIDNAVTDFGGAVATILHDGGFFEAQGGNLALHANLFSRCRRHGLAFEATCSNNSVINAGKSWRNNGQGKDSCGEKGRKLVLAALCAGPCLVVVPRQHFRCCAFTDACRCRFA